mmetsp:Transcript_16683/g.41799  ORF Transcript_16683/g.41799 Transcript_16683/m.41799 type:complete len:241 (-) Transcript_16683:46-768(-)
MMCIAWCAARSSLARSTRSGQCPRRAGEVGGRDLTAWREGPAADVEGPGSGRALLADPCSCTWFSINVCRRCRHPAGSTCAQPSTSLRAKSLFLPVTRTSTPDSPSALARAASCANAWRSGSAFTRPTASASSDAPPSSAGSPPSTISHSAASKPIAGFTCPTASTSRPTSSFFAPLRRASTLTLRAPKPASALRNRPAGSRDSAARAPATPPLTELSIALTCHQGHASLCCFAAFGWLV